MRSIYGLIIIVSLVLSTVTLASAAGPFGKGAGNGMGPGTGYNLPDPVNFDLSDTEIADLLFMREEEQMAHDLYQRWSEMYQIPIFGNIAQAETTHAEEVQFLLDRYDIASSVGNLSAGYTNPDIQTLALDLVAQGDQSLDDALRAGIAIEEHDITDLDAAIANTSREDIQQVYLNLRAGSENHLKSFQQALG